MTTPIATRELGARSPVYTPSYETHGHRFLTPGRWLNSQISTARLARVGVGEKLMPSVSQLVRGGGAE